MNMRHLNTFISAICSAFVPGVVFAHAEHTFQEEALLFFWSNQLALIGVAMLIGILVGGAIFLFRHDKKMAFNSGLVLTVLFSLAFFVMFGTSSNNSTSSSAQQLIGSRAIVYKSENCSCCGGYIEELKRQGSDVDVRVVSDAELAAIKIEHNIAQELQSCHTSIIDGYVVEGHVPIEAVAKLRSEKPDIKGIALPGMPSGTPGMPGPKLAPYNVQTLDKNTYLEI